MILVGVDVEQLGVLATARPPSASSVPRSRPSEKFGTDSSGRGIARTLGPVKSQKRWDGDERGPRPRVGAPFAPGDTALQEHLAKRIARWTPHAHPLRAHRAACSAVDDVTLLEARLRDDGVLEVVLDWQPTVRLRRR